MLPRLGADPAVSGRSCRVVSTTHRKGEGSVITILDAKAEFAKLNMLCGRTPTTGESERKGAFAKLAEYRDGGIFTAKFAGRGPWERHQTGDELVQIVDGATTMHLMTAEAPQTLQLTAGMIVIVPQGMWHHF